MLNNANGLILRGTAGVQCKPGTHRTGVQHQDSMHQHGIISQQGMQASPHLHQSSRSCKQHGRALQLCRASVREQKDPKSFRDMDAAREYLHRQAADSYGPIAGLLNWLSSNAFGAGQAGLNFGSIYRQWLQFQSRRDTTNSPRIGAGPGAAAAAAYPETVPSLAVLMFMSEHRVQQLVDKYPQVMDMQLSEVAQRLLLLKQLLPRCDVARMIELQPSLLLGCKSVYLSDVVVPRLEVMTAGLPGADIATMVQEDPRLLFEELESSLPRLHELWPTSCLDAHAFAASDPAELALALRALSDQGPPRKY